MCKAKGKCAFSTHRHNTVQERFELSRSLKSTLALCLYKWKETREYIYWQPKQAFLLLVDFPRCILPTSKVTLTSFGPGIEGGESSEPVVGIWLASGRKRGQCLSVQSLCVCVCIDRSGFSGEVPLWTVDMFLSFTHFCHHSALRGKKRWRRGIGREGGQGGRGAWRGSFSPWHCTQYLNIHSPSVRPSYRLFRLHTDVHLEVCTFRIYIYIYI